MTYNASIPQPTDFLSVSQGQILTNFSQLNVVFGNNHVAFDDGTVADRGKHNFCSFLEQSSDPTTAANEIALYSKDSGTQSELYFREESDGDVVQITSNGSFGYVKAFARFAGTTGTSTVAFGCSVVRDSMGVYTVTLSPTLASANYSVTAAGYLSGGAPHTNIDTYAAGSFIIRTIHATTGAALDIDTVSFTVFL